MTVREQIQYELAAPRRTGSKLAGFLEVFRCRAGKKQSIDRYGNLAREEWRHRVADLNKLLCSVTLEKIVVRKCLETGGLSDRQAAALRWIGMDEVMTVLGDRLVMVVAGHIQS